jgi:hypothetical protein
VRLLAAGRRGTGSVGPVRMSAFAFTVGRRMESGRQIADGDGLHSYDILATRLQGRSAVTARF